MLYVRNQQFMIIERLRFFVGALDPYLWSPVKSILANTDTRVLSIKSKPCCFTQHNSSLYDRNFFYYIVIQ